MVRQQARQKRAEATDMGKLIRTYLPFAANELKSQLAYRGGVLYLGVYQPVWFLYQLLPLDGDLWEQ